MIDSVNNIQQHNYNTVGKLQNKDLNNSSLQQNPQFTGNPIGLISFNASSSVINGTRTSLSSKEEKQKYTELLKMLDKESKKQADSLLKRGILLNSVSNDNSTVLDNLYKMATTPRAEGLNTKNLLKTTIATIAYPPIITQQFGDIPNAYRGKAIIANTSDESNSIKRYISENEIDVEHSGTCVAASIEFSLAQKMPAEFVRFAEGLSSAKMSVDKEIKLNNLADNPLDAIWLLNAFEIPYKATDFDKAILTFAPDNKALIRAQIQTTHKDANERSPIDVLMQSTFMQVGSQQSYNTLTDKRGGKFNQNDKGLIEFEKTFTESVVEDKNKLSVTYQTVDENARLIGYETDLDTMKRHLTTALDKGENVIIGYTQVDQNNIIINGHEITLIGYRQTPDGKVSFICNDTDDGLSKPIEYSEDYLLPKIHHAALPKEIVEADLNVTPNWVEGLEIYKQNRQVA